MTRRPLDLLGKIPWWPNLRPRSYRSRMGRFRQRYDLTPAPRRHCLGPSGVRRGLHVSHVADPVVRGSPPSSHSSIGSTASRARRVAARLASKLCFAARVLVEGYVKFIRDSACAPKPLTGITMRKAPLSDGKAWRVADSLSPVGVSL